MAIHFGLIAYHLDLLYARQGSVQQWSMTTISSNLWSTLQGLWHISLEIHTAVTHLMERTREVQLRICVWNAMLLGIKRYGTFCFEVSAAEGPAATAR